MVPGTLQSWLELAASRPVWSRGHIPNAWDGGFPLPLCARSDQGLQAFQMGCDP